MFIPILYSPAPINDPPVAEVVIDNQYIHIGELVSIQGGGSYDPEGLPLIYDWKFTSVPAGSQVTSFTPALADYSVVTFVPDVVGIYTVQLIVSDGYLTSDPVSVTMVSRQLPVPHGQAYEPDMRWMFNFVRDWMTMIEDREKIAVLWSSYAQVLSELLLRIYEVNLGKSIATIPELLQWRWSMYRLRVDLPDSYILTAAAHKFGTSGRASTEGTSAVILEQGFAVRKDRVIVFDGQARTITANGTPFPYTDFSGTSIQGTRVGLAQAVDTGARHARWWICTGTVRLENNSVYTKRAYAGDLLEVSLEMGTASANVQFRIYGVTPEGYIGFEFTRGPLSDSYDYYSAGAYKTEVLNQIEQAFFSLNLDPGQFTYRQLSTRFIDLCRAGDFATIFNDFGISLVPKSVYRLSRFETDPRTVTAPYLQPSIRNPIFVLRENEDYAVQEDADGRYIQLANSVTFDETDLPRALWAEVVFLDNAGTIEDNFGLLVGGERSKLPSRVTDYEHYRGAVAGLMYAFASGPTPDNIRLGVQIVLGLPFTAEKGIVRLINTAYSSAEGMIVIEDVNQDDEPTGFQRVYKYPLTATLETNASTGQVIKTGDLLPRFFPLCTGVEIRDWVNTPDWWTPIYDGRTELPKPHEAFFNHGWNPSEENLWPEGALEEFEEAQKVHIFEVRLDSGTFDVDDVLFAERFVRGVNQTWRLGLEKKGIRPHYTYPLFVVTVDLVDQVNVRDRLTLEGTLELVDDTTGYETSLRDSHRNTSGALLMHVNAPMQASRLSYHRQARFTAPTVDGVSEAGAVRLDLDVYAGTISVGETLTGLGGDQAEVVAIEAADPADAPITHIALVRYNGTDLFQEYDRLDNGAGGLATILNECPTLLQFDEDFFVSSPGDPDSYNLARYRDMVWVEEGPWEGWYGVWRVNRDDTTQLVLFQLRTDNPTYNPPTPYGTSDPNGTSSYRPNSALDRTTWQSDTSQYYCQVMRPYHNPIHCPELYMANTYVSQQTVAIGGLGFHDWTPLAHFHRENFRSGYVAHVKNINTGNNHRDLFEIVRESDGTTPDELTAAELTGWEAGSGSPRLRVRGPAILAADVYNADIYDPRLPYPKELEGLTLPSQAGIPDNFSIDLPAPASLQDDYYNGMYFRALSGSGAWDPGVQEGHWYIVDYEGATRRATIARNHRGVFDATTEFEIVSFKPTDHAPVINILHDKFPGSLLEHSFLAPLKAGDDQGGGPPHCTITTVSGNPNLVAANIGNVRPAGKDFVTANTAGDAPFDLGVVQVGDLVVLHAQNASDRRIASQIYTVTGNILAASFDVTPAPLDTSAAPLYFTIYRAGATVYEWNGATYVVGTPVLYSPVTDWTIW